MIENHNRAGKLFYLWIGLSTLAIILSNKLPVLFNNLAEDAGTYMMGAWLLQDGDVLYEDFWESKPPGVFYALLLARSIGLPPLFGAYIQDALLSLIIALVIFGLLRRVFDSRTAAWGTLLVVIVGTNSQFHQGGMFTESFMILPEIIAAWVFVKASRNTQVDTMRMLAVGVLAWLAFWFKPVGIAPALAALAWLGLTGLLLPSRRLWAIKSFTWLLTGLLLAGLVTTLIQPWSAKTFWFASLGYNLGYAQLAHERAETLFSVLTHGTLKTLWVLPLLTLAIFATLSTWPTWKEKFAAHNILGFLVLWALADFAGALVGGYGYAHYFVPFHFSAAVAGTVGGALLLKKVYSDTARFWIVASMMVPATYYLMDSLLIDFQATIEQPVTIAMLLTGNVFASRLEIADTLRPILTFALFVYLLVPVSLILSFWHWGKPTLSVRRAGIAATLAALLGTAPAVADLVKELRPAYWRLANALDSNVPPGLSNELRRARWVKEHVSDEYPMMFWGHEFTLYFLIGAKAPQRIITPIHLAKVTGDRFRQTAMEILADWRRRRPVVLIDQTPLEGPMPPLECAPGSSEAYPLKTWVCENYRSVQLQGSDRVYLLDDRDWGKIPAFPGASEWPPKPSQGLLSQ